MWNVRKCEQSAKTRRKCNYNGSLRSVPIFALINQHAHHIYVVHMFSLDD
jgi:hypothetical protein